MQDCFLADAIGTITYADCIVNVGESCHSSLVILELYGSNTALYMWPWANTQQKLRLLPTGPIQTPTRQERLACRWCRRVSIYEWKVHCACWLLQRLTVAFSFVGAILLLRPIPHKNSWFVCWCVTCRVKFLIKWFSWRSIGHRGYCTSVKIVLRVKWEQTGIASFILRTSSVQSQHR